jgi:hypothetical protein
MLTAVRPTRSRRPRRPATEAQREYIIDKYLARVAEIALYHEEAEADRQDFILKSVPLPSCLK